MTKIKLIFFDMEGTLFKKAVPSKETMVPPSAWVLIAQKLGQSALEQEKQTQGKWNNGLYANYIE